MLNSFAEIEKGALDKKLDKYRFQLSRDATRMWPKFEREMADAAGSDLPRGCAKCRGCAGGGCFGYGTYVVNNASADDLDDENFDAIVKTLGDFDERFEFLSPRDIPNYNPAQRHRSGRALYIHGEGWLNPRRIMEKLDAALVRQPQVDFIDDEVDKLVARGGRIDHAVTQGGRTIGGDKFVLATGATSTDLLNKSGLGLNVQRVFYGVGVSVEIKSPDHPHTKCIRTPNRGLACGLYTAPYFHEPDLPNDHVLVGASNFISPVPSYHGRLTSVESLMRGAIEQINVDFYRADLIRVNVGWRPTSQDTYPLLGKTSVENFFIATGTKRDGFHLSPLISEKLCNLILGQTVDTEFGMFAPERDLIKSMSREEAIQKAVRHQVSASYQHGFQPPHNRLPEQIRQMFRDDLERLHDKVGAKDWGIPPEMLDMYRYGHASA